MSNPGHLNPTAPMFFPTNLHPIPFFLPQRIYHALPPPPSYHLYLPHPPPPPPLPPSYPLYLPHAPPPPPPPPSYPLYLPPPSIPPPPTSTIPTRAVLLLSLPSDVTESSLRQEMETFGHVRGVDMERANEGLVTVYFYNLKHSQTALEEIRKRHMQQEEQVRFHTGPLSGRFVWAEFVFPQFSAVPHGNNQGSLVIMNLEPTVSSSTLRQIFQAYGEVKELRETPEKKTQRFVEFYDVRDASLALCEMDGENIAGKSIAVQFSRPGGRLYRSNKNFFNHHSPPPPSPLSHHHPQLPSPRKVATRRNRIQHYEQQENKRITNNNLKTNVSDACYIISDESIDGRTTVMIKNLPNKFSQKMLLNILDKHCKECNQRIIDEGNKTPMSSYDFFYLPTDFSNKCNMGYGFVNMTSHEGVFRLYKSFHNQHWENSKSTKICEVTYARLQGLESLKEHFKNPKLEYMPVIFSPPRDGRLMMEPLAIADLGSEPDSCQCGEDTSVVSCSLGKGSDSERLQIGGFSLDDES